MLQRPAALAARTCARGGRVTSRVHPEARTRRGARRSRLCRTISSFTCGNCRHGCSRSRHIIACNTVRRGATESSMLQRLHCPASPHLRRRSRAMPPAPCVCAWSACGSNTRRIPRCWQPTLHARAPNGNCTAGLHGISGALRMGPTSAPGLGSPLPHLRRVCTAFRAASRMGPGAKAPVATLREYWELLQRYCWGDPRVPQVRRIGSVDGLAGAAGWRKCGCGQRRRQRQCGWQRQLVQAEAHVDVRPEGISIECRGAAGGGDVQRAACKIGCESIDVAKRNGTTNTYAFAAAPQRLHHSAKGARHGCATSAPGLTSPLPHLHRDWAVIAAQRKAGVTRAPH